MKITYRVLVEALGEAARRENALSTANCDQRHHSKDPTVRDNADAHRRRCEEAFDEAIQEFED